MAESRERSRSRAVLQYQESEGMHSPMVTRGYPVVRDRLRDPKPYALFTKFFRRASGVIWAGLPAGLATP